MTLVNLNAPVISPAQVVFDRLSRYIARLDVGNDRVLVAVYVRPDEKHLGDGKVLYTAPQTQKEDGIQGKAALVLKIGPCVNPEGKKKLRGFDICVGDWIAVNASDGWSLTLGSARDRNMLRLLSEASIHMKLDDPDLIW